MKSFGVLNKLLLFLILNICKNKATLLDGVGHLFKAKPIFYKTAYVVHMSVFPLKKNKWASNKNLNYVR